MANDSKGNDGRTPERETAIEEYIEEHGDRETAVGGKYGIEEYGDLKPVKSA